LRGSQLKPAYLFRAAAQAQVEGAKPAICKGYKSKAAAIAAFEYATRRSWTRVCTSRSSSRIRPAIEQDPIPLLPTPLVSLDSSNPLHGDPGDIGQLWYVVYTGITPGVYQSLYVPPLLSVSHSLNGPHSLECKLNTVGIRNATHQSFTDRGEAIARFQAALDGGRVKVLTHSY
jgi:hypothetical protein